MKLSNILTAAFAALALIIVGCEEKKAPVPHDHDGDGVPDHGPGEHGKPQPVPHDHDGDGKPDHGPGAHDDHSGHDHAEKAAGPNGGRIITEVEPHAEFFVTADNKVRISFLDDNNKAVSLGSESVSIVCGDRSNPTMLSLEKHPDGNSLVSTGTLPSGNLYPVIVTFKTAPDATPVLAKFSMNLSDCPTCDYKEYACTCDHGHEH